MKTYTMNQTMYWLFFIVLLTTGCNKDKNTLEVSPTRFSFEKDGGTKTLYIETDASSWNIQNPHSEWLELSESEGNEESSVITMTVQSRSLSNRYDTLIVSAGDANPVEIIVVQLASTYLFKLTADQSKLEFPITGGTSNVTITTDAEHWSITSDVDWLEFSQPEGKSGSTPIQITTTKNLDSKRNAIITIGADNTSPLQIPVSQDGNLFPNYNTHPLAPDNSGMTNSVTEIASRIRLGWNIGNTLEAQGSETAWGNPKVTKELIDLVKQHGFNAIRIPCAWNQYMANGATAQINSVWLNRVKEVIQYCVDNDMYVLLNIHWDGGWLENNCTVDKQNENNAKQKAFWEQIATHMRDFDEHLMFASANEPNVDNPTQMAVLNSYHQTFVDAVRSTGGRNSYRILVVQGPSTDIDKTNQMMTSLPSDPAANRLMVEIHYYTPWSFCGLEKDATWGKMFYYWGKGYHSLTDSYRNATWGEETTVDELMGKMKTQFVDKGIPVIMGEFGAMRRTGLTGDNRILHLASRAYYLKYVTHKALENGILPFYWDTGCFDTGGSGLFYRDSYTISDQQALDALNQGATFNQ